MSDNRTLTPRRMALGVSLAAVLTLVAMNGGFEFDDGSSTALRGAGEPEGAGDGEIWTPEWQAAKDRFEEARVAAVREAVEGLSPSGLSPDFTGYSLTEVQKHTFDRMFKLLQENYSLHTVLNRGDFAGVENYGETAGLAAQMQKGEFREAAEALLDAKASGDVSKITRAQNMMRRQVAPFIRQILEIHCPVGMMEMNLYGSNDMAVNALEQMVNSSNPHLEGKVTSDTITQLREMSSSEAGMFIHGLGILDEESVRHQMFGELYKSDQFRRDFGIIMQSVPGEVLDQLAQTCVHGGCDRYAGQDFAVGAAPRPTRRLTAEDLARMDGTKLAPAGEYASMRHMQGYSGKGGRA